MVAGRIVITEADVQAACGETAEQACWLLREDGSTFTAWIPSVELFRPPAWPRYLTTCEALRRGVQRDGLDKTARFFTGILKRKSLT